MVDVEGKSIEAQGRCHLLVWESFFPKLTPSPVHGGDLKMRNTEKNIMK